MFKFLLKNSFLILLSNLIFRGSIFLFNVLCIRLLPQQSYGQLALIRSTASTIEGFISGALGPVSIREISGNANKNTIAKIIYCNLFLVLFSIIIIILTSPFIIHQLHLSKSPFLGISLLIILLFAIKTQSMMQNIFMGLELYLRLFSSSIISFIIGSLAFLIVLYYQNLTAALISLSLYYSLDACYKIVILLKLINISIKFNFDEIKSLLKNVSIYFYSIVINSAVFWLSRVVISNTPDGLVKLANFDACFQLLTIIMIITGATNSVILPMLAKGDGAKKIIFYTTVINALIVFFFMTFFAFFSFYIMAIFGQTYNTQDNKELIYVMIGISFLFSMYSTFNKLLLSSNQNKSLLKVSIFSSLICIIYIYSPLFSDVFDLAYAYIIMYSFSLIGYIYFVIRKRLI